MKKVLLISILAVIFLVGCNTQGKFKTVQKTDSNGYKYEYVENDELKTRIYTLENGLKVYISPNSLEPRFTGLVGVRAGSTSDPLETTGLAHYLEHMMFKGTQDLGTTNWEEESKLIAQIEELYEQHKKAETVAEKKSIYHSIDSLSNIAAKYVATNEYDKLMSSIGARNSNAMTSYESTVFINDVPVNELEKWAQLESERFHGIVLRLFHTEIEAVYEEFNMYQDMDSQREQEALFSAMFPTHPYGRDIIGYPEHLKNPSMVNIQNFFKTYYVPNNMSIVLSGDLDYEATIKVIDKYFGDLESKELPDRTNPTEEPIANHIEKEVAGPEAENIILGYRVGGEHSEDNIYINLLDMIMCNSQAGLIDLDLVQQQKVLSAYSYHYPCQDYGMWILGGEPLQGQSLEEVKGLLMAEIDKIKAGDFEEWLIPAVINDLKLSSIKRNERNQQRAFNLMSEFISNTSHEEALNLFDRMSKITKADLVKFANEKLGENYVVVYKRQGDNKDLVKVEKPAITAVPVNRDLESEYAKNFNAEKSSQIEPVFVNFDEQIEKDKIKDGCNYYYVKNNDNELFSLTCIVEMGSWHSREFDLAMGYLDFIGTSQFTPAEFQKELYRYGLTLSAWTENERARITIGGLNKSLDKGIELMNLIFTDAKADQQAYTDYVNRILKQRQDVKTDPSGIRNAMQFYGIYGPENPQKYILSEEELKTINPEDLVEIIKGITSYEHSFFYYGQQDGAAVKNAIASKIQMPDTFKPIPEPKSFVQTTSENSTVYIVDFDISQANILLLANDIEFDKSIIPAQRIYNEFYGSGLSSIVFQEIRESKALAYSSYSDYITPTKIGRRNILVGYIGTQADKLSIATSTLMDLLNNMPMATQQYDMAREAIMKVINSERITKEQIFWTWLNNKTKGIDYDIRKDIYEAAQTMDINEFKKFFDEHIKGHNYTYMILGKKSSLDMTTLQKLGEVKELSLEELFGY